MMMVVMVVMIVVPAYLFLFGDVASVPVGDIALVQLHHRCRLGAILHKHDAPLPTAE